MMYIINFMIDIKPHLEFIKQESSIADVNYLRKRLPKGDYKTLVVNIALKIRSSALIIPYLMIELKVISHNEFTGYIVRDFLSLKDDNLRYALHKINAILSTYTKNGIPDDINNEHELEHFLKESLEGSRMSIACSGYSSSRPIIEYLAPINNVISSAIDYADIPNFTTLENDECSLEIPF